MQYHASRTYPSGCGGCLLLVWSVSSELSMLSRRVFQLDAGKTTRSAAKNLHVIPSLRLFSRKDEVGNAMQRSPARATKTKMDQYISHF